MLALALRQIRRMRARLWGLPRLDGSVQLIASPPAGQKGIAAFKQRDFLLQQFALEQHLPEPRLEAVALALLAILRPGRQASLAGSGKASPQPHSVVAVTHRASATPCLGPRPQEAKHRVTLALPRHSTATPGGHGIHLPCPHPPSLPRISSACGMSHSTVRSVDAPRAAGSRAWRRRSCAACRWCSHAARSTTH